MVIPELGMYYYKARIYSATLSRFLQTDPIGYDDQINLHAYLANDPVNKFDQTGKWSMAVYERLFVKTVGNELKGRLPAVKRGSLNQDLVGGFLTRYNNEHYLGKEGQSPEDAKREYQEFVKSRVTMAREAADLGLLLRADQLFAQAAHAVQDSYSPVHNRDGLPGSYPREGHSPTDSIGKETTADLSAAVEAQAMKNTQSLYRYIYNRQPIDLKISPYLYYTK